MIDQPLVSICIPTYNAASTIRETLASILAQTYPNLVVHVSDNASIDDTIRVLESFEDPRIVIHRNEVNIGGEGNFNRCIQLAEGKYTAIFHADDLYEPEMVERQVAFLESHSEAGAVFTEACLIDERGAMIGELHLPKELKSLNELYDFATMFKAVMCHGNFFICPSFMVRTQIYQQEIKAWRGDMFGSGADLDVWLRILQRHTIGHIDEPLIRYRIGDQQFSAQVRRETEKGLLFKIVDHYLEQEQVVASLDVEDMRKYKWLERRDRVMRALNFYLTDCQQEVGRLLDDIYSWDAFNSAFRSKRGMLTLVVGVYIKLLVMTGLKKIGKPSLSYMKRVTHK